MDMGLKKGNGFPDFRPIFYIVHFLHFYSLKFIDIFLPYDKIENVN